MTGGDTSDDARQLAALGHTQELKRTFSPLAMLGLAFAILNSWTALATSLSLALPSGGPTSVLWGLITAGVCNLCLAASLAEFLSAYPSAGGQYHWAAMLCPRSRIISWITGWINVSSIYPRQPFPTTRIILTHRNSGWRMDGLDCHWRSPRIATHSGHHLVDGPVLRV
jgi:amino acid permease